MSLLSRLFGSSEPPPPVDPFWRRNDHLKYPPLIHLASRSAPLRGKGGVFVLWSLGVRPLWLTCGPSSNMEETVLTLVDAKELQEWERRGSMVFTWSPIVPAKRDGVTHYLRATLPFKAVSDSLDRALGIDPEGIRRASSVPVLPPG